MMREAGPGPFADRVRGLIAILWRAGLRISEALALTESDLDPKTGSALVRAGKGGKRRIVGMDDWAWEHVRRWTEHRIQLPIGPLFCIPAGPTRGRGWSATAARGELRECGAPVLMRFSLARVIEVAGVAVVAGILSVRPLRRNYGGSAQVLTDVATGVGAHPVRV